MHCQTHPDATRCYGELESLSPLPDVLDVPDVPDEAPPLDDSDGGGDDSEPAVEPDPDVEPDRVVVSEADWVSLLWVPVVGAIGTGVSRMSDEPEPAFRRWVGPDDDDDEVDPVVLRRPARGGVVLSLPDVEVDDPDAEDPDVEDPDALRLSALDGSELPPLVEVEPEVLRLSALGGFELSLPEDDDEAASRRSTVPEDSVCRLSPCSDDDGLELPVDPAPDEPDGDATEGWA